MLREDNFSTWSPLGSQILIAGVVIFLTAMVEEAGRLRQQLINGSQETLRIEWLKNDGKRNPKVSLAPGEGTVISTALRRLFAPAGKGGGDNSHQRDAGAGLPLLFTVGGWRADILIPTGASDPKDEKVSSPAISVEPSKRNAEFAVRGKIRQSF